MLKRFVHKLFNMCGFDIITSGNLEHEVTRRIADREREHILSVQQLRDERRNSLSDNTCQNGITWVSRDELASVASKAMRDAATLLDIGCAFRPQQILEPNIHICCEPFPEYMDRLIAETASDKHVYLQCNIEQTCAAFPDRSVDTVFLQDVIEHIDRDIATNCLETLKAIAKLQVILFTPIGYMPQDPNDGQPGRDQWGMGGIEWQKHRSGWTTDDFPSSDGWYVVACRDFHQVDGYGRPLEEPFGAMWAIWNRHSATTS